MNNAKTTHLPPKKSWRINQLLQNNFQRGLRHLGIAQKINIGYGIVLILAIGGMATGSVIGYSYQRQARELIDDALEENVLIEALQINLMYAQTQRRGLAVTVPDTEKLQEEYVQFQEYISKAREAWSKLKISYQETEFDDSIEEIEAFQELVEKYDGLINTYFHQVEAIVKQIPTSDLDLREIEKHQKLLIEFSSKPAAVQISNFAHRIGKIKELINAEKALAAEKLRAMEGLWIQIQIVSVLLSIITSTLLAIQISRAITRPLKLVTDTAQKITNESNFDLEFKSYNSKDELSALTSSFNYLVKYVKELLENQQKTNEQLKLYNSNLEATVQERTKELSNQNLYLEEIIKELKFTQAKLIHSEKMSSLGQLVAGIAHEINNPVSFIHGNIIHAQEHTLALLNLIHMYQQHVTSPPEEIQTTIEEIELDFIQKDLINILQSMTIGTQRISEIVLGLRNFSRLDESDWKQADIHSGLDSTLMILEHRLKATKEHPPIKVIKQYGKLPLIECFPGQLNQVFMNIFANAIDALEESCKKNHLIAPIITISTQIVDNKLEIKIADNGSGMTQETINRLFDPFFTTKPVGKGTGLGLSISYQIIVEKHHGNFAVNSVLGKGSEFVITIPVKT